MCLNTVRYALYYILLEITGDPCDLIGSQQCDLYPNRTISAANEKVTQTLNNQSGFQGLFKVTNKVPRKWKPLCDDFCNCCSQNFALHFHWKWKWMYLKAQIWFQSKLHSTVQLPLKIICMELTEGLVKCATASCSVWFVTLCTIFINQ